MAVEITREPEDSPIWSLEHCCFCASRTRFWHTPKDVPVCQPCAEIREASEVPSKQEWLRSPQAFGRS
jgi:hypothetical protein